MRNISRKLVLSIIAVVLTVFALGSTTFAWFTLTNTSTVQPFSAEVIADSGIEISLGNHSTVFNAPDEANWVTTLNTADIEAFILADPDFTNFDHVTTADGSTFFTLGATALTGTTQGYIELPLSFRSNTSTVINWSNVTLTSPDYTWNSDSTFTDSYQGSTRAVTAGDDIVVNAADAMRISMISGSGYGSFVVGYENPSSDTNDVLGQLTNADLSDGIAVGEGSAGSTNYFYSKNTALPFGADDVTTLTTITSLSTAQQVVTLSDVSATPEFGASYFGQITVRIWLEGWDADAYNAILSQVVTTSFVFQGV
ncbi:hypothetical protein KHQ89_06320 [Mycoplasmatota bacterium]|nr:hypothetical protein KHQ89_06320 [Mycoplasmatota bacterium]